VATASDGIANAAIATVPVALAADATSGAFEHVRRGVYRGRLECFADRCRHNNGRCTREIRGEGRFDGRDHVHDGRAAQIRRRRAGGHRGDINRDLTDQRCLRQSGIDNRDHSFEHFGGRGQRGGLQCLTDRRGDANG
jgi:hypothetical protein